MPLICGIDEAGRGPIAGPVCAAAAILPKDFPIEILADSKLLSGDERLDLEGLIKMHAKAYAIGWAMHSEIDRLNIHFASLLAMERAFFKLPLHPEQTLIDGKFLPSIDSPSKAIVQGDALIPEIMAASILAKTARDRWMIDYSKKDDRYFFEKNKGYPTKEHKDRIALYGPCPIHRMSFKPFNTRL